ncbi:uncharacterized protein LOC128681814 isoform X2 [Plodia interpunctella]|uniref:uncharacterized protein LOC128681814 isoform X2 n=1 Tax=Plodia interpunctella TaxID=58824 RepID=UPI002368BCEA|nr:uncharacterized protein LOC128681814 isoform X2 [Plodia interpunctella]
MRISNKNSEKHCENVKVVVGLSSAPYLAITTIDIWRFFSEGDLANVIRISTVSGPFSMVVLKMSLFYYKRHNANSIIQEMERDYALANSASKKIRNIVQQNIKNNIFYEKLWTICVFIAVFTFPFNAAVMNVLNNINKGENGYMITDLNNPFAEDAAARFESPYFEIMFIYTFFCCCQYFVYFTGFEAFIMVSTGHACLKFELANTALEDAILIQEDGDRNKMVGNVIREHNRTFRFVDLLNDTFNLWLGILTIGILAQLCCCMFYILEGYGFDERYSIFTIVVILYIYIICYRAHQLKATAEATPTRIFNCGWESNRDIGLRKTLCFMIARFQSTVQIQAIYFFLFDMEFFVFIVKTAYSMFTLLKK